MTAQLGNIKIDACLAEQRRNLSPQACGEGLIFFMNDTAEDFAYLFLGAASMASSAALEPFFDFLFDVTNNQLGHALYPRMIS